MKRRLFLEVTAAAIIAMFLSHGASAQDAVLKYEASGQSFQYKDEVKILNVTDTEKMHVSTDVQINFILDSRMQRVGDNLELQLDFTDIELQEYKRELQILNNEKRNVGPEDLSGLQQELTGQVQDQWVQLKITDKGTVLKKDFSPNLLRFNLFNLTRLAEQFVIPFPPGIAQVGFQWEDDFHAPLALTTEEHLMGTRVKYTYLGKETQNGISCYKFNASLALQEERPREKEGGGISWVSYTGHSTLYFAVTGAYLVKGTLASDLSFLMIVEANGEQFVNFLRTRIDQNIELVKTIREGTVTF